MGTKYFVIKVASEKCDGYSFQFEEPFEVHEFLQHAAIYGRIPDHVFERDDSGSVHEDSVEDWMILSGARPCT